MRKILQIDEQEISPAVTSILANQSIPANATLTPKIEHLVEQAKALYLDIAEPRGIIGDISLHDFAIVYEGEGFNDDITPVQHIYPFADNLALFAVTVGEVVSSRIDELFENKEFAMASMLDSVASAGADRLAYLAARQFCAFLKEERIVTAQTGILAYSPGYCGWHISGQKMLFEFINPGEIGITLLPSFLMKPLKSITGVLIAAKKTTHVFIPRFPACEECKDRSCQKRIKALFTDEGDICKGVS